MTQPLLEILEHAIEVGPIARPSSTRTEAGETLTWSDHHVELARTVFEPGALVAIQLSRSVEQVMPVGIASWIGEPPRRVDWVHLQLRRRDGLRLRLRARISDRRIAEGLPELVDDGEVIDFESLRDLALSALAMGARLSRFEARVERSAQPVHRILEFADERAPVRTEQRWGFVNSDGELIVPCQYDEVRPFSEGRAAVRVGRSWGYIDAYGRCVVPPIYDQARPFWRGVAWVKLRHDTIAIDRRGNRVHSRVRPETTAFLSPLAGLMAMLITTVAVLAGAAGYPLLMLTAVSFLASPPLALAWWTSRESQRALSGRPRARRMVALPRA